MSNPISDLRSPISHTGAAAAAPVELLRFNTCGSVDDGKSTLIGRLLYEAKMLFEDQLTALEADSKKMGTQGGTQADQGRTRRPRLVDRDMVPIAQTLHRHAHARRPDPQTPRAGT